MKETSVSTPGEQVLFCWLFVLFIFSFFGHLQLFNLLNASILPTFMVALS